MRITSASWSWRSTSSAAPPDVADDAPSAGTRTSSNVHDREPPGEVDGLHRRDRRRPARRRDEHLREAVAGAAGDEQVVGLGGGLDRRFTPLSTSSSPSTRIVGRPTSPSRSCGAGSAKHHVATTSPDEQAGERRRRASPAPPALRAAATTLVGDQRPGAAWRPNSSATSVRSTTPCAADAAAAVLPRRRAATSSRARRPGASTSRSKPAGSSRQAAHLADGHSLVEEPAPWSRGRTPGRPSARAASLPP